MKVMTTERTDVDAGLHATAVIASGPDVTAEIATFLDPLEDDEASDEIVLTSRRAICRVALVATETALRFQREAVEHEPMAWLLAPRRVFEGAAAIDACLERDACLRAVILHGLGLGLDVEGSTIDALIADDGDEDRHAHKFGLVDGAGPSPRKGRNGRRPAGRARLQLYTATILDTRDNRMRQYFHASLARDEAEVRTRLSGRFGPDVADLADIRPGIHVSAPAVVALVPQAVVEMIQKVEREGAKPHARTFAVDIELGIQA